MKLLPALLLLLCGCLAAAEPEFPLTEDSKPQAGVAKGTIIKDKYIAGERSVFPGTEREYQIYLPDGFAKNGEQPAPFMVFQDGVVYQAPVVFDNLIAKKDIPPLIGIFIRPGVVPAAHENALPRFNRSHEYDSVTDDYSRFLIEEFLPAIEKKHRFKLSTNGDHAAISGNSSGGICAFVAAWHRPDRFRRVFTGVGTYVGIHGADRFPVLLRKMEPKPLRIFLQSGTQDNNLYCGDWWMANQMMERSLAWAGYDVNHAWGEGGHNQKHASQVFPDAMRWLWRGWQTDMAIKANAKGESKWKGYEVLAENTSWIEVRAAPAVPKDKLEDPYTISEEYTRLASDTAGEVYAYGHGPFVAQVNKKGPSPRVPQPSFVFPMLNQGLVLHEDKKGSNWSLKKQDTSGIPSSFFTSQGMVGAHAVVTHSGLVLASTHKTLDAFPYKSGAIQRFLWLRAQGTPHWPPYHASGLCLSPDQTQLYAAEESGNIYAIQILETTVADRGKQLCNGQQFHHLESASTGGLCVDIEGRLYAATQRGIEVCDQAGRVNFIIPTPEEVTDVCFGGLEMRELYIACGKRIYKQAMTVIGLASGQRPPVKPAPPKL